MFAPHKGGRMTALALLLIAAASPVAAFAPSGLALRGTVRPAQCGVSQLSMSAEPKKKLGLRAKLASFGAAFSILAGVANPATTPIHPPTIPAS
ncbi:hypothetical protein T484DRAFT_1893517 [Baffinella frigidus]|nr:hypothetical protein T484DRAFT_1893517 [Cryptophyta sp. CCMP2293]